MCVVGWKGGKKASSWPLNLFLTFDWWIDSCDVEQLGEGIAILIPEQRKQYFRSPIAIFGRNAESTLGRASFGVFNTKLDLSKSEIHSLEPALDFALVSQTFSVFSQVHCLHNFYFLQRQRRFIILSVVFLMYTFLFI